MGWIGGHRDFGDYGEVSDVSVNIKNFSELIKPTQRPADVAHQAKHLIWQAARVAREPKQAVLLWGSFDGIGADCDGMSVLVNVTTDDSIISALS